MIKDTLCRHRCVDHRHHRALGSGSGSIQEEHSGNSANIISRLRSINTSHQIVYKQTQQRSKATLPPHKICADAAPPRLRDLLLRLPIRVSLKFIKNLVVAANLLHLEKEGAASLALILPRPTVYSFWSPPWAGSPNYVSAIILISHLYERRRKTCSL